MKLIEFIYNELVNIAKTELKAIDNSTIESNVDKFIKSVFSTINLREDELFDISYEINDYKDIKVLKNFYFIIEHLFFIDEYEFQEQNLKIVEARKNSYPNNKLYKLLWIFYKLNDFENNEYIDKEYASFLNEIFTEGDYLINLEDFYYETKLQYNKNQFDFWEKEIFLEVFERAVKKYPDKLMIRKFLALIYFQSEDFMLAHEHYEIIIEDLEKERDRRTDKSIGSYDFGFEDFMDIVLKDGIILYKIGEIEKSKKHFDFVIGNIPTVEYEDEVFEDITTFEEAFFYRIMIDIGKENKNNINNDFDKVKGYLEYHDWQNKYPDIFEYAKNNNLI